jgi:hydroxymethylglutaryl-CoA reductase (NADPH)
MKFIPRSLLSKLYNRTSLKNTADGFQFSVKNRLSPVVVQGIEQVAIDERVIDPADIQVTVPAGDTVPLGEIGPDSPIDFPLGALLRFRAKSEPLIDEQHHLRVVFKASPFGKLELDVKDRLNTGAKLPGALPRDSEDDYGDEQDGRL